MLDLAVSLQRDVLIAQPCSPNYHISTSTITHMSLSDSWNQQICNSQSADSMEINNLIAKCALQTDSGSVKKKLRRKGSSTDSTIPGLRKNSVNILRLSTYFELFCLNTFSPHLRKADFCAAAQNISRIDALSCSKAKPIPSLHPRFDLKEFPTLPVTTDKSITPIPDTTLKKNESSHHQPSVSMRYFKKCFSKILNMVDCWQFIYKHLFVFYSHSLSGRLHLTLTLYVIFAPWYYLVSEWQGSCLQ